MLSGATRARIVAVFRCPRWRLPPTQSWLGRWVLVQRATQAAEALLYKRFAPRVRLYGLRHLRNPAAADDLVQRVMLLTLEKLRARAVHEPERIASFVLGTARMMAREAQHPSRAEPMAELGEVWAAAYAMDGEPLGEERLRDCMQGLAEREL